MLILINVNINTSQKFQFVFRTLIVTINYLWVRLTKKKPIYFDDLCMSATEKHRFHLSIPLYKNIIMSLTK